MEYDLKLALEYEKGNEKENNSLKLSSIDEAKKIIEEEIEEIGRASCRERV